MLDRAVSKGNFYLEKSFLLNFFFISIIFLMMTGPSFAETITDIHKNLDETAKDSECLKCHSSHTDPISEVQKTSNLFNARSTNMQTDLPMAATEVIGNITVITGVGQNWYQQGINGLGVKTWGWTFFDETVNYSGKMIPPETTTQRNNIYALLLDSGNNSAPVKGAQVTADISFWTFNGENYTNSTNSITLTEDPDHSGYYSGFFYFTGNSTSYPETGCQYCHVMHEQDKPQPGHFPGNYTGTITAQSGNKESVGELNFEVTPWGCEDCHGSPNPHKAGLLKLGESCYLCHSLNDMGHDEAGNPHQIIGHRDINCTDCHTGKSLSSRTFNNVSFVPGGINNNRSIPQYNYTTTQLNGGTHLNLTCDDCHGDLALPIQQGGYKNDNYTIRGTINNYTPTFASIQQFQDYYVINVTSGGDFNISLDWEGTSNIGFFLFPPNYIPDIGMSPYYDGSTFTNKPEKYNNSIPVQGDWILVVYGYDFIAGLKTGQLQTALNYTLNSTYPIKQKNLPVIPECNSCHNSNGAGKAFTTDNIPDWNPGFAHVDTNNDGSLDIQCRLCHDALHEITVKECRTCHTTAPVNHPIKEPDFSQKTSAQCLECHGDPHLVTSAGGTDCIACHSPNDVNISKFTRHADINKDDGVGNVTNNDCWTCHFQKDMNRSNVYLCESCHINDNGVVNVTDPSLIKGDFMHGMTTCKTCHAPAGYHQKGRVGPLGAVETILKKMIG